jgi:alpha-tubulin suppressor-like RCC1 family protein
VAGGLHFLRVSAGSSHTCGITTANRAYCWGDNQDGELGDGTTTPRVTPTAVAGTRSFRQISSGPHHTCGVTTSDIALCWGSNEFGKLGNGLAAFQQLKPVRVAGGLLFRQVIAGGLHSCGSTTDNRGYCWGANNSGQLGNGTRTGSFRPVAVAGGIQFRMVVAAGGIVLIPSEEKEDGFSCGLTTGDVAYCWGFGPLGNSTTNTSSTPIAVAGGRHFRGVNLSHFHVCAVTNSDVAFCWGNNDVGQLGDGTFIGRAVPVRVAGGLLFKSVTANSFSSHSCGVTTANRAYCWGAGTSGQLGSGTTPNQQPTPLAVAGPM